MGCLVGGKEMEMMGRVVRVWMGGRVEEKKRERREGSGNDDGLDVRAGLLCRGTKTTSMRMR